MTDKAKLIVQAVAGIWLIIALAFHLAEVGIIGLTVIVFITALNGIIEEHQIGEAFKEALPFTALLVVFFAIVAVIQEQNLFAGIIGYGLSLDGTHQIGMFYLANGILSAISDNVFVATVYINEVFRALQAGTINREQFDLLAVAINTGTNIPSVATPNGQAAFLFLLTSSLAPIIRLSYGRMVWMALPYTITMTLMGLLAAYVVLEPATSFLYDINLIHHHSVTGNETGGQPIIKMWLKCLARKSVGKSSPSTGQGSRLYCCPVPPVQGRAQFPHDGFEPDPLPNHLQQPVGYPHNQ